MASASAPRLFAAASVAPVIMRPPPVNTSLFLASAPILLRAPTPVAAAVVPAAVEPAVVAAVVDAAGAAPVAPKMLPILPSVASRTPGTNIAPATGAAPMVILAHVGSPAKP